MNHTEQRHNNTIYDPHQHSYDDCSNCSKSTPPVDDYCSTCNNSQIEYTHHEGCNCSVDHHQHPHDEEYSTSSSQIDHHYHSGNSSWQEELKSASSNSSESCKNSHCKNHMQYHRGYSSERHRQNYNHHEMPISTTLRSITNRSQDSRQTDNKVNGKKRGKRCCFPCCCCRTRAHSRITVFFIFFLCILGAFAAFFCWPRTPRVSMGGGADSISGAPDWWAGERQPLPSPDTPIPSRPSLRATWQINVTLDNRDNWIPTRLNHLDFVMVDSLTLAKFAWASTSSPLLLPPGIITPVSLTFNVNYQAADRTDPTFQNLYNACGPINDPKQRRPALNVILRISFHIFGILWTPMVTATPYTGGILCPTR